MHACSHAPEVRIEFDSDLPWLPVELPGSKSIAARALISGYVFGLTTRFLNLPDCDDTLQLSAALNIISAAVPNPKERCERTDMPEVAIKEPLFAGEGGTTFRFLLAVVASIPGLELTIDCGASLRKRPLSPLIKSLRSMGAEIECLEKEGFAPLRVSGKRLSGGKIDVDTSYSSQFLSALILASPLWERPLKYDEDSIVVSRPYIEMTCKVMDELRRMPESYIIQGDWSAATYFYEMACAKPGREIRIKNFPSQHLDFQGDRKAEEVFKRLAVQTLRDSEFPNEAILKCDAHRLEYLSRMNERMVFNLVETPDIVPALAASLCIMGRKFRIEGVGHLRYKESDRLLALSKELQKAGYMVRIGDDEESLEWEGVRNPIKKEIIFDSWNDHRIAMAVSCLAVPNGRIRLAGTGSITKSFPRFFDNMKNLGIIIR